MKRTKKPEPKPIKTEPVQIIQTYKTIDPFGKPVEIELKTIHDTIKRL